MSARPASPRPRSLTSGVLTFLIADVRGYTTFTRSHGDEAAARLAAAFAEIVREGVEARDGEVLELRGDEALAVFASARQALRAAVELQRTFGDEVLLRPELPLNVGVGLDAGEAVPLEAGYRGAALNMAARLCSKAGAGEVLASEGVVHLAGTLEGIRFNERGELDLKGIDRPPRVLAAVGVRRPSEGGTAVLASPTVPQERRLLAELPPELDPLTPSFGRDREARSLRWAWRAARRGPGHVAFVAGPAGAGKTRLAAEPARLAGEDGATVLYVRSSDRGEFRTALRRIGDANDPLLVVFDDLHASDSDDLRAFSRGIDRPTARPVLVVAAYRDDEASDALHQAVRRAVDRGAASHRVLGPLDEAAVRAIAALYADDRSLPVPVQALLEAADGWPGRVHELAGEWARGEASRRVGENASRAAEGRTSLRRIEAELAANVIDLQCARERASLYTRQDTLGVSEPGASPFKGLASFDVEDAALFFGRERLVAELVGRLAGSTFLGVVGPSGSGKSSVVRAGLVPALAAGMLPGSERWTPVLLRPGERPLRELDRALYAALPERLRARLGSDDADLLAAATAVLPAEDRLLVVVDQFEEVFTACRDEEERARFIDTLVRGARDARAVVVVAVRADFYGRCASHPDLAQALAANHVLVGPMTADEYRRAIEQPAARSGLRVESTLVDALVSEVVDEPGALPLLSTALLELWQRRDGRVIRMDAYQHTGGVRGAVARLAEEAYGRLSSGEQAVARSVLLRLSRVDGETAVRRRVPLAEFDTATNPAVRRVLDVLTEARLLTVGEGTVEIAHEALLREWPRLVGWLDEDREGRRLREHLTEAAREWAASGRDPGELYRGARLASALDWTAEHGVELNELEREFVSESRAASERDADRQRRSNRRLRMLLAGVGVLFAVSLLAGWLAVLERREAERAASIAEEQRVAAEEQRAAAHQQREAAERAAIAADAQRLGAQALVQKDLDLALLLARQGVELEDSPETRGNLLAALVRSPAAIGISRPLPGRLLRVRASPDGRYVVVANNGGQVALVETSTGTVRQAFQGDDGFFAEDGSPMIFIHAGRLPPTLRVLDRQNLLEKRRFQLLDGLTGSWSPDLRTLTAIALDGRSLAIHDATTRSLIRRLRPPPGKTFFDVHQFAGGHLLTFLHDGPLGPLPEGHDQAFAEPITYAWWQPGRDEPTSQIRSDRGFETFAVSPTMRTLALGHTDGSITLFDLRTGRGRDLHGRHNAPVTGLAFAPDSDTLVSGGDDRVALVWDVPSGELRETLSGHNGRVFPPAVVERGDQLTAHTVSLDGSMMTWDLSGERRLGRPFDAGPPIPLPNPYEDDPSFAVSPDGALIAIAAPDGTVLVRDTSTLGMVTRLRAVANGHALDVAFSPDGRRLAVAGMGEDLVRIWDTATWRAGPALRGPPATLDGRPTFARTIAFSPDGRILAAGVAGRKIWLWETGTGEALGEPLEVRGGVLDLAFGPRSDVLAAAEADFEQGLGIASVWRLSDRRRLYTVDVDSGYGRAATVVFSPDGRLLATGGGTGDVRFWDASSGEREGRPVQASAGWLHAVRFDPTGMLLVTGGGDGTLRLYDAANRAQLGAALPGPDNQPSDVGFSPSGDRVFAVYANGRGYAWDVSLEGWKSQACRVAGRTLTEQEWEQFLPDRPYAPVCREESAGGG